MSNTPSTIAPNIDTPMPSLSAYIATALALPLPEAVLEKAKFQLLDTLAAIVSGSQLLAGQKAIAFLEAQGSCAPQATIAGTRLKSTAINAALANGMFGHADETDDSHAASLTHPGCGIVPAVLAATELYGASGMAMLRALTLGYDVCCRLTLSLDPYPFRAAGHSTHTFGPNFGAAAAAGALAGVDAVQARYLMSYAAQQASGVSCWMRDRDHVEKAFDFGGMAARNGMTAAVMVHAGFTGVDDVFSGERCFYDAYGAAPDRGALGRELGTRYEILDTSIKRWTVGSPIQAPLDALDLLVRTHGLKPEQVKAIEVRIPHESYTIVDNREMPEICLQHLLAALLVDGRMSFASAHDRARMRDPAVLAVRDRMTLVGDDELSRAMPVRQGIVAVTLEDGSTLREHTRAVRGTPPNPMTRAELEDKCRELLAPVLGAARSAQLCAAVWALDQAADGRALAALLVPLA
ncbi:MAG TPA: MmgE/PrpD family protein [Burkholderiales bacterium]|jgi:2-methylcitrate dehydratase PrpD|nr:MmgE/PrpD family protein [Burkholderiales bacterium]